MTRIGALLLGSAAAAWIALGARAAELPSRKAPAPEAHARTCTIDGAPGFMIAGSDTCLKISGDVRFETIIASKAPGYAPGVTVTKTGP
jgi:Porin subfamily